MKKTSLIILVALILVTMTACAPGSTITFNKNDSEIQFTLPGPNPELDKKAANGSVPGFGTGLWHGFISLVTLFISFFNPAIQMYEVHNTGPLYNLGFLLGAIFLFVILGFMGGRRR